jgi:hypothetical protein
VALTRSTATEPPSGAQHDRPRVELAPWVKPALRSLRPALPLLGIYAVVRLALLLADSLSAHIAYGGQLGGPVRSWDSHFYLGIADHGYPSVAPSVGGHLTYSAANFGPTFPGLIRIVEWLGLSDVGAAMVVSVVSGAVATVLVWQLATELYGESVGRKSALLFATFPGMAIAWGLVYSECIGLTLVAGSLLLMVRERWVWAGVVGALATATNAASLPLVLAALVPTVQAVRARKRPSALATVVIAPAGFGAYVLWLGIKYHDVLYWWHLNHQAWGTSIDFGRSLLALLPHLWARGLPGPSWLEWLGVLAVVGAVIALVRAKPPGLITAYCAGVLVILFVSDTSGFRPRLLTWAFPALIAVAAATRRRGWLVLATAFASLLPLVFVVYTTLGNTVAAP